MPYIFDISTAVPPYSANKEELINFYSNALESIGIPDTKRKISFLTERTKINKRYSCIPDFNGMENELYSDGNYKQPVEKIISIYKEKILPLAIQAIDKVLRKNNILPNDVTHIITVSCTGIFAPGLEFLVAEHYGMEHTEKIALNFLGCYAAVKALKQANYIAKSEPNACILIVCAELCSLHFYPSDVDEDISTKVIMLI